MPHALAHCTDESVIGAPFYVMQYLDGIVPHDATVLAGTTAETNARLLRAIRRDPRRYPCARRRRRRTRRLRQARGLPRTAGRPLVRPVGAIQSRGLARDRRRWVACSVSGCRSNWRRRSSTATTASATSCSTRTDAAVVLAVLDWEMATLGDPLSDLAYTLLYWSTKDRPLVHPSQAIADLPGFPTAGDLVGALRTRERPQLRASRLLHRVGRVQAHDHRRRRARPSDPHRPPRPVRRR